MDPQATQTIVSGQMTLPSMTDRLGYGSIKLDQPWMESFCWAYVLAGKNATKAIREVKPHLKDGSAWTQASKLLRNDKVLARIAEVEEEQKSMLKARLMGQHDVILDYDPLEFFDVDPNGKTLTLKPLHLLPEWLRRVCTLDTRLVGKHLETVVVMPDKDKSRSELAKILAMITTKSEIGGVGGAPLSFVGKLEMVAAVPDNE